MATREDYKITTDRSRTRFLPWAANMDKFFADVSKTKKKSDTVLEDAEASVTKALPKGVVLGKDGKPFVNTHLNSTLRELQYLT